MTRSHSEGARPTSAGLRTAAAAALGAAVSVVCVLPLVLVLQAVSLTPLGAALVGPPASPPQSGDRSALFMLGAIAGILLLAAYGGAALVAHRKLGLSVRAVAVIVLGELITTTVLVLTWH